METLDLSQIGAGWQIIDQYPLEFIESNRVLKFSEDDELVKVAFVPDITPKVVIGRLRRHHHPKRVHFSEVESSDMAAALARVTALGDTSSSSASRKNDRRALDQIANDAPVINLVNSLILDALGSDASDIHIEVNDNAMIVRFRIDGVLRTISSHEEEKFSAVSSRIKIMANLNIMETRRPQDGRITVTLAGQEIHLRISIVPLVSGESIVLRLFNRSEGLLTPEKLGFPSHTIDAIRELFQVPFGLVLVTGPTGSGKTTTLSTFLSESVDEKKKIITLEDPVEYVIPGVDQIPIRDDIGMGFSSLLRRVLRQDPDVIMIGEIRDSETAELAVRAALTGHLVLSTLHTNDAPSAIYRLIDMGIPSYLVGAVLRGVLAQRLVRSLCAKCKTILSTDGHEKKMGKEWGVSLTTHCLSNGCVACGGSGYQGRTAISEWFAVDKNLERLIASSGTEEELRTLISENGYKQMISNGLSKVAEGKTTLDEIYKVVQF